MFTGWEKELLTTLQDVKLSKTYSHVKFVPDCGKRPEEIDMASTECESEEEKEEDDTFESFQRTFKIGERGCKEEEEEAGRQEMEG